MFVTVGAHSSPLSTQNLFVKENNPKSFQDDSKAGTGCLEGQGCVPAGLSQMGHWGINLLHRAHEGVDVHKAPGRKLVRILLPTLYKLGSENCSILQMTLPTDFNPTRGSLLTAFPFCSPALQCFPSTLTNSQETRSVLGVWAFFFFFFGLEKGKKKSCKAQFIKRATLLEGVKCWKRER